MSRSFTLSEPSELKINESSNCILGSSHFNEPSERESHLCKQNNVKRVPKRSLREIVSPLSMTLTKENLRIEDSKAFCF